MAENVTKGLRPVLTPDQISDKVRELAERISDDYAGETPLMVAILKGGFVFLSDLVRAMAIPVEIDFAQISSYGDETESSGRIRVIKDITTPIAGRHVIVVEDIIDTGRTLKHYLNELRARGPASLKVCALINKPERREFTPDIDYLGFTIPRGFLVGYGLDRAGRFRELPGVYEVPDEG
ncbi:MAG: hypoxanthine phosphoribosyltransferase [bacterium]|nr:MAG: hypoxanthine phosphoribosyltransferase [bacterium]